MTFENQLFQISHKAMSIVPHPNIGLELQSHCCGPGLLARAPLQQLWCSNRAPLSGLEGKAGKATRGTKARGLTVAWAPTAWSPSGEQGLRLITTHTSL